MTYTRSYSRRRKATSSSQALLFLGVLVVGALVTLSTTQTNATIVSLMPLLFVAMAVVIIGTAGILWYLHKQQIARLRALQLSDVDTMTGVAFEHYVGKLLEAQGYHVTFTSASNDFGVDIIARKGKDSYATQLKRYTGAVGRFAITDAVGGLAKYGCTKAMAITNSHFTPSAKELAAVNNCVLVDRDQLAQWIVDFQHTK